MNELEQGREAYRQRRWADAYAALASADEAEPLRPPDLELLATSASLVGRMDEYLTLLERAHQAHLEDGHDLRAARTAIWLGMNLAIAGEIGPAGGWFGRAQRLVEREEGDSVEDGYLLVPLAFQRQSAGEHEGAYSAAAGAASIAQHFGDADLFAIAVHFQGLVRINQGRVEEGLRLLDEAMVGVVAGETSPVVTGIVYCGVIACCEEAFEPRRAHEWTNALARWWQAQPQMVSFTGRCLAHRAGIKQLHGAWRDALDEARVARERCERAMNRPATGQALYQQGELHRLQGELEAAEAAYREASRYGREPQPGLALLRLLQGDTHAAAGAIRRVVGETAAPMQRAALLPAYAEIMLAAGELEEARAASRELDEAATLAQRPMLTAIASHVRGAVELAEGNPESALAAARRAAQIWLDLDAPYEIARARVLIGTACATLGDDDGAALELDAAREVFERLSAGPELARVDALTRRGAGARNDTHGLTARELEVLRLVAAGKTNREIAATLVVSEHTVARHVQNILTKTGVSSRTAATAFAFEHGLV
jgi:DNA-binding CsgD family transcriptional regulator